MSSPEAGEPIPPLDQDDPEADEFGYTAPLESELLYGDDDEL